MVVLENVVGFGRPVRPVLGCPAMESEGDAQLSWGDEEIK